MSHYKRSNGHLQARSSGGQFRVSTLGDFNLGSAICPKCGAINAYELATFRRENGFVEKVRNGPPTNCEQCGSALTSAAHGGGEG